MDVSELQADSIAYDRIAMIYLKGDQTFTDQEDLFRKAREKAAEIGANGLMFQSMTEGKYSWFWGTESPRQGNCMALRWRIIPPEERKK
jgi:hypothetical protein